MTSASWRGPSTPARIGRAELAVVLPVVLAAAALAAVAEAATAWSRAADVATRADTGGQSCRRKRFPVLCGGPACGLLAATLVLLR